MKPHSITAFQTHGISRHTLQNMMQHYRVIPPPIQAALIEYKLLRWNYSTLANRIHGEYVNRFGKDYLISWATVRGQFISAPLESVWMISFRDAMPEYNLPPIAVIWKDSQANSQNESE